MIRSDEVLKGYVEQNLPDTCACFTEKDDVQQQMDRITEFLRARKILLGLAPFRSYKQTAKIYYSVEMRNHLSYLVGRLIAQNYEGKCGQCNRRFMYIFFSTNLLERHPFNNRIHPVIELRVFGSLNGTPIDTNSYLDIRSYIFANPFIIQLNNALPPVALVNQGGGQPAAGGGGNGGAGGGGLGGAGGGGLGGAGAGGLGGANAGAQGNRNAGHAVQGGVLRLNRIIRGALGGAASLGGRGGGAADRDWIGSTQGVDVFSYDAGATCPLGRDILGGSELCSDQAQFSEENHRGVEPKLSGGVYGTSLMATGLGPASSSAFEFTDEIVLEAYKSFDFVPSCELIIKVQKAYDEVPPHSTLEDKKRAVAMAIAQSLDLQLEMHEAEKLDEADYLRVEVHLASKRFIKELLRLLSLESCGVTLDYFCAFYKVSEGDKFIPIILQFETATHCLEPSRYRAYPISKVCVEEVALPKVSPAEDRTQALPKSLLNRISPSQDAMPRAEDLQRSHEFMEEEKEEKNVGQNSSTQKRRSATPKPGQGARHDMRDQALREMKQSIFKLNLGPVIPNFEERILGNFQA